MPAALLLVESPILHPIAARAGDVLAWYPAADIAVMRRTAPGQWDTVRTLGFDNAGALAGLLADEAIRPVSAADAARVRPLLARHRLSLPEARTGQTAG